MANDPFDADDPDQAPCDEPDAAFEALLREVAEAPRLVGMLSTIAFQPAAGPEPFTLSQPRALPGVGDVVDDRYQIQVELGRGGMGVVFGARNLRTEREVALKWMLPRGLTRTASERRESVMRFVREARAVSRVDHPNVVRVLDVGGDPESPYLVMERLEGESLGARLTRGSLSWDEALSLLLPVMRGVSAAHRAGVVHRDLKPDNIFLSREAVKVLDFGVSRIGGNEGYTTLTRTGTMLGTPAYMPLEQLRGSREVDARTDVYALGVILFEALSGRLPFEAQTAADQAVLLATRRPEPLGELLPSLRGARADVVMKALAKDPGARYPTVDALAAAFEAAAVGSAPSRKWVPLVLAGLAAAVLIALLLWRNLRPADEGAVVRSIPAQAVVAPRGLPVAPPVAEPPPVELAAPVAASPTLSVPALPEALEVSPPLRPTSARRRSTSAPAVLDAKPEGKLPATGLSVDQFRGGEHATRQPVSTSGRAEPKRALPSPTLQPDEF